MPRKASKWRIQQTTGNGSVPDIGSRVDPDVRNGRRRALGAFGRP
jgi:hypothetical protein